MALFKYYKKTEKKTPTSTTVTPCLPTKVDSLSEAQLQKANNHIRETVGDGAISCRKQWHHYNEYSAKERADIGKYAAENGAKACRHFPRTLGKTIPESTVQGLKSEYLTALGRKIDDSHVDGTSKECQRVRVSALPKKVSGRPLLLGEDFDATIREFVQSLRKVGGVVNTSIVMAAAEGIVAAKIHPYWLRMVAILKLPKDGLYHCFIGWAT